MAELFLSAFVTLFVVIDPPGCLSEGIEVESSGTDHDMNAGFEAGNRVRQRGIRGTELNHHVTVRQDRFQTGSEGRVGPAGQLQAFGLVDCVADRSSHAPCGPCYPYPDHRASASLTGLTALRKRSSSLPTAAAERSSWL